MFQFDFSILRSSTTAHGIAQRKISHKEERMKSGGGGCLTEYAALTIFSLVLVAIVYISIGSFLYQCYTKTFPTLMNRLTVNLQNPMVK